MFIICYANVGVASLTEFIKLYTPETQVSDLKTIANIELLITEKQLQQNYQRLE